MKTGLPACEGRGPQLSAAMVDIAIRKCPMVIIAGEEKMYLIAFGDGSLLLAAEEFIADALQMIGDIAQAINAGQLVGADTSWCAAPQTSASFRAWADEAIAVWQSQ